MFSELKLKVKLEKKNMKQETVTNKTHNPCTVQIVFWKCFGKKN